MLPGPVDRAFSYGVRQSPAASAMDRGNRVRANVTAPAGISHGRHSTRNMPARTAAARGADLGVGNLVVQQRVQLSGLGAGVAEAPANSLDD